MQKHDAIEGLVTSQVSRRDFAKRVIVGGVAATAGLALSGEWTDAVAQSISDVDILNFALNLEYLEAEFYTVATTGRRIAELGIATSGTGRAGATIGGGQVSLDARSGTVARHITFDEQAHVRYLRAALGSAAVAKPTINLEALGLGFRNQGEFLTLARAFEDLGVSAYGGAAYLIDNPTILTAAARIGLTEAQHAGVLRLLVSDAMLSVPPVDGLDVLPLMSPGGRMFQVDGQGLSTIRTAPQVLAAGGAFFPDGLNGTIR